MATGRHHDEVGESLTPMGQVESIGRFARGLGPRRVRIGLAVGGAVLLLLALLTAIT